MKTELNIAELMLISQKRDFAIYPANTMSMRTINNVIGENLNYYSYDFAKSKLSKSIFESCKFENAIIQNTDFNGCIFSNTSFSESSMDNCKVRNCIFINCSFFDSDIYEFSILNSIFIDTDFLNSGMTKCILDKCVFNNNINIESAAITDNIFYDCIGIQNRVY
jgi:uncharacterized protein YjbI with pentapeptide repeats